MFEYATNDGSSCVAHADCCVNSFVRATPGDGVRSIGDDTVVDADEPLAGLAGDVSYLRCRVCDPPDMNAAIALLLVDTCSGICGDRLRAFDGGGCDAPAAASPLLDNATSFCAIALVAGDRRRCFGAGAVVARIGGVSNVPCATGDDGSYDVDALDGPALPPLRSPAPAPALDAVTVSS